MIDLYYAPTPNGWKICIMLEECEMDYKVIPVNLGKGDQFKPEFLKISPNNRMPAIVDHENQIDGEPLSIFESGAILMYLGEKSGQFFPQDSPNKEKVLEWLFWQVGGLGPMAGQVSHFVNYAPNFPGDHSYSEKPYKNEYDRLLGVMDNVLAEKEFLAGDYSIADMASTAGTMSIQAANSVNTHTGAMSYITKIDEALSGVATEREQIGAVMNRLDHTISNLDNVATNLATAKGRIEDADFAAETSNLARTQVLQQASMAMLAQANASKQNILSLFQ